MGTATTAINSRCSDKSDYPDQAVNVSVTPIGRRCGLALRHHVADANTEIVLREAVKQASFRGTRIQRTRIQEAGVGRVLRPSPGIGSWNLAASAARDDECRGENYPRDERERLLHVILPSHVMLYSLGRRPFLSQDNRSWEDTATHFFEVIRDDELRSRPYLFAEFSMRANESQLL